MLIIFYFIRGFFILLSFIGCILLVDFGARWIRYLIDYQEFENDAFENYREGDFGNCVPLIVAKANISTTDEYSSFNFEVIYISIRYTVLLM